MYSSTARFAMPSTPTSQSRSRRNTVDLSPQRPNPVSHRVKNRSSQQEQYQYRDHQASFDGMNWEEEERAHQDIQQAIRANRRDEAPARRSRVVRKSTASKVSWNPENHILASPAAMPLSQRGPLRPKENYERRRLESFKFPRFQDDRPPQPELLHAHWCPPPPTKRLAPLAPFNPLVRARSESMSSVVEEGPPSPARHKRNVSVQNQKNAPVQALFQRIHAEARKQGFEI
ncbi:hypothetical protein C8F01DRAFT_399591 [Mycena amicta]|nr:hypothetical protein C8F01DRAFT_399591 [Mycena amicta]